MPNALRSVMSRLAAMSRSRTPGSWAIRSRTRAWTVRKVQLAPPTSYQIPENTCRFLRTAAGLTAGAGHNLWLLQPDGSSGHAAVSWPGSRGLAWGACATTPAYRGLCAPSPKRPRPVRGAWVPRPPPIGVCVPQAPDGRTRMAAPGWPQPAAGCARGDGSHRERGVDDAGDHSSAAARSVEVVPQELGAGGVAELGHGLGLDLPDPLPGDPVDLADLLQGLGLPVGQPEPQGYHARLTLGQRAEDRVQLLLQQGEAGRLAGLDGLGVLDQVAELAVAVLAERGVQRNRLTAVLLHLDDPLRGHAQLGRDLLRGRLAAQVLEQLPLDPGQLADGLGHVRRQPDGAGLVGHGAGDGLADPPGGVRGELVALGVVELLHRADQAQVALLDQGQEQHAAAGVALGQGHDQAQVGLEQVVLGPHAVVDDLLEVGPRLRGQFPAVFGELLIGEQPGLDPLGQLNLLRGVEQPDPADLVWVVLGRVGGSADGGQPGGRKVLVVIAGDQLLVLAL